MVFIIVNIISQERRGNRALTQRYDIHALKKINAIEDEFRMELSKMYSCDPDDVPINLDILELYNQDLAQRKATIVSGDTVYLITKFTSYFSNHIYFTISG